MPSVCRMILVDDHPIFRNGLRRVLEESPNFSVLAEAGTANDCLRLAREINPDLIVLDISLPDRTGLDLMPELRAMLPKVKLLVVSMHRDSGHIMQAFQAGARGYVTKDSVPENLRGAVNDVMAGEVYLDPTVSKDVLSRFLEGERYEGITDVKYGILTQREKEVMRLMAEGCSGKAIADRLRISPKTVDVHRNNMMRKLCLDNTVDLIRYAARLNLIDLESWKTR